VEGAVRARLGTRAPVLGRHGEVRCVRRVEQLGDALVGERVALLLRRDEAASRIVGVEAARLGRRPLEGDRGQRQRVLVGHRVLADDLDHVEGDGTGVVDAPPEPHQASLRPDLVRTTVVVVPPRQHEVDLLARRRILQEVEDRPVRRRRLVAVDALTPEPFRSEVPHRPDPRRRRAHRSDLTGDHPQG
jgi:hypothetical protein